MEATSQATLATVVNTLANVSNEDLKRIIGVLQTVQQRNATGAAAAEMKTGSGVKKAKAGKTRGSEHGKKAKQAVTAGAPKRPLNSFMAYRKFYGPVFSPHTQKVRSKCITITWKADLFEAKWAIVAKGYSVVRGDRDKSKVPLDKFLVRVQTMMVLIEPANYLRLMGWKLDKPDVNDETKTPRLTRVYVPTVEALPSQYTTLAVTVEDIVQHCLATGLIASVPGAAQNGALTMAVQPGMSGNTFNNSYINGSANDWSVMGNSMGSAGGLSEEERVEFDDMAAFASPDANTAAQDGAFDVNTLLSAYGESQLGNAALGLDFAGEYPHLDSLNPNTAFNNQFEPTQTNGGFADESMFDAFNMAGDLATGQQTFSFDEPEYGLFVNEDVTF